MIVIDDVAESEYAVFGVRLSRVRRNPLDPGFELVVLAFRFGSCVSLLVEELREGRQQATGRVTADVVEIDLIELEKQEL